MRAKKYKDVKILSKEEQIDRAEKALIDNAFLFLKESTKRIKKPIIGITQLSTAVELLLKARLIREHWTLLIEVNPSDNMPAFETALSGEKKSIRASKIVDRIEKVTSYKFSKSANDELSDLFKERNNIVHWYRSTEDNRDEKERLVKHQCCVWHHLEGFLRKEFMEKHEDLDVRIQDIDQRMKKSKRYFETKCKHLKDEGVLILLPSDSVCLVCGCKAFRAVDSTQTPDLCTAKCQVCNYVLEDAFKIYCPSDSCEANIFIEVGTGESQNSCMSCDHIVTQNELGKIFNSHRLDFRPEDYMMLNEICTICWGSSIGECDLGYVCLDCLSYSSDLYKCTECDKEELFDEYSEPGERDSYLCEDCRAYHKYRWYKIMKD